MMAYLQKYADRMKFRLIDVFKQFDKNNDWRLTFAELVEGVQVGCDVRYVRLGLHLKVPVGPIV